MKKKILFISVSLIAALLFAAFTSCAGGGTNSGESASSFENSGSKESSEKEKTSEEPKVIYEKAKNVMTAHNILDNIYLWDLYSIQTDGGLYFKDEFAKSPNDSHPGKEFSEKAANLLFQRIIDIIENDGTNTLLTGEGISLL